MHHHGRNILVLLPLTGAGLITSPSWANGSESDAHHVYVKALKARVGFCSVSLSLTMRMESGVVPSAWVLEQDGIWKTATVEPHLMSNEGERESFLIVSP